MLVSVPEILDLTSWSSVTIIAKSVRWMTLFNLYHTVYFNQLFCCPHKKGGQLIFEYHLLHNHHDISVQRNSLDTLLHFLLSIQIQWLIAHFQRLYSSTFIPLFPVVLHNGFTPFYYQRQWVHFGCVHPCFQITNQRRSLFYFPSPDLWRITTAHTRIKATSQYCFCYHRLQPPQKQTKKKFWSDS